MVDHVSSRHRSLAFGVVVTLTGGQSAGCAGPGVEVDPGTAEGEAVLAALEHVAAEIWEEAGTGTLVKGKAAVAYRGEEPLAESARGFLDEAFAARGWRWSTEDPLVPTGDCVFPGGDCRLKDPTELHLTFSMVRPSGEACAAEQSVPPGPPPPHEFCWEPVAGKERHGVHIQYLSSYTGWRGRDQAELGGYMLLVTYGRDGWEVEDAGWWVT